MSIEAITVLWGILPAGVALLACLLSITAAARRRTLVQLVVATIVVLFTAGSLWTLKEMFFDQAWPTYIPHVWIGIAVLVAFAQWRSARPARKSA